MPTPVSPEVAVLDKRDASAQQLPDFTTEAYKDAYSRINAIVIEEELTNEHREPMGIWS